MEQESVNMQEVLEGHFTLEQQDFEGMDNPYSETTDNLILKDYEEVIMNQFSEYIVSQKKGERNGGEIFFCNQRPEDSKTVVEGSIASSWQDAMDTWDNNCSESSVTLASDQLQRENSSLECTSYNYSRQRRQDSLRLNNLYNLNPFLNIFTPELQCSGPNTIAYFSNSELPTPLTPTMFSPGFSNALNAIEQGIFPPEWSLSFSYSSNILRCPQVIEPEFMFNTTNQDFLNAPKIERNINTICDVKGSNSDSEGKHNTSSLSLQTTSLDKNFKLHSKGISSCQPPPYNSATATPLNAFPDAKLLNDMQLDQVVNEYVSLTRLKDVSRVAIMTPKVAIKSYGNERRFFCPPPIVLLRGKILTKNPQQLKIHVGLGLCELAPVNLEWIAFSKPENKEEETVGRCVARQLYIPAGPEDRRRQDARVHFAVKVETSIMKGEFTSRDIKVISKPSKKRQCVKNMEMCIHHGATVALYHRYRSQTVTTKLLTTSTHPESRDTMFAAQHGIWDVYRIWIVDSDRLAAQTSNSSALLSGTDILSIAAQEDCERSSIIHYNQCIVLQCVKSGLISPVFIVRRVEKGSWVEGAEGIGDPVSQLHKIALQFASIDFGEDRYRGKYLSFLDGSVVGTWAIRGSKMYEKTTLQPSSQSLVQNETFQYSNKRRNSEPSPSPGESSQADCTTTLGEFISLTSSDLLDTSYKKSTTSKKARDISIHSGYLPLHSRAFTDDSPPSPRRRRISADAITSNPGLKVPFSQMAYNPRRINSLASLHELRRIGMSMGSGTPNTTANHMNREESEIEDRVRKKKIETRTFDREKGWWVEDVGEPGVWTIVATETVEYTFSTLSTEYPVYYNLNPVPRIDSLASMSESCLVLHGENLLTEGLKIYFGEQRVTSEFRNQEGQVMCRLPEKKNEWDSLPLNQHTQKWENCLEPKDIKTSRKSVRDDKVPILLVRQDGIVYDTGKSWSL
ncbi:uncharacterized protein VTP21DRAFT_11709 [Calcarisporiella thermophila]|uniref:uncharacterized protein n=1 Tax=Calcarisporiella thermophila TaxID=911321 RepID=UPI0037427936